MEVMAGRQLAADSARLLEERLLALGVRPALEPTEEKLYPVHLAPHPNRVQIYVPNTASGMEPRDLTDEDITTLAESIADRTKAPTFYRLKLPEAVESARLIETRSVSVRHVRYYSIGWDKCGDRLDVLFDKEDAA